MRKLLNIFGILVFQMFINKSNAVIPDCNFYDTVNISGIKEVNNAFMLGDLIIPVNQTGLYDMIELVNGSFVTVKNHRRACVCKNRECMRFCCPRKKQSPLGSCSDDFQISISEIKEMGTQDLIILTEYACEDLKIKGYTWNENEAFIVQSFHWTSKMKYKIYMYSPKLLPPAVREIGVISLICYILTIAVYLYVKKLQNLGGKCFICCLFCMFMKCLFWVLNSWKLLKSVHFLAAYMTYFFWMASFLWFFALNHVFWERFGFDKSKPPRFRFSTYSFFVWDSAAILTVLIYTLNYFWKINPRYMCQYSIWLKGGNVSIFYGIYYGLILTVSLLNMMFTILTIRILRKQIRDLKKSNPVMEVMSYLMWLRLSTILGVTWSLDLFLSVFQTYHYWPQVLWLADYFHAAFGITIFVLFVLKRSTLQWLKEGNRVNRTQNHPDAHMAETAC